MSYSEEGALATKVEATEAKRPTSNPKQRALPTIVSKMGFE